MHEKILILDFGSQYTRLIARKIRENNVYCEIHNFDYIPEKLDNIKGIVLSGGPSSVYEKDALEPGDWLWKTNLPILGICYGMQYITKKFDGEITEGVTREYGSAQIIIKEKSILFEDTPLKQNVWMSHSDIIEESPPNFNVTAYSENNIIAAFENVKDKIYGIQFHPEVKHTEYGKTIIKNFLYNICGCSGDWKMEDFIKEKIKEIQDIVQNKKVILGLSGGVDSTVASVLMHKAIGNNLTCFFIDNGLLRKNEMQKVKENFKTLNPNIKIEYIDASEKFLSKLKGISDPEEKRKIIGHTFIEVFEEGLKERAPGAEFLVQGTLYPDVIESSSHKGPSATIKTHHNVGGLPEKMNLKIIEPFRELFKDEVREVGKQLGISEKIINRHPFPGPGLAVRILGEISKEKLEILREVDEIFINELIKNNLYNKISQALAVLLPIKSVGVMGDQRTYQYVTALRAVVTTDFMTADIYEFELKFLKDIARKIINNVKGVNRVVYDISSKPPATIEWE